MLSKLTHQRGIFFGRRLLNKPFKGQSHHKHDYDQGTYMVAMKQFHMETRGMLRDSAEYEKVRNRIYGEMRDRQNTA